LGNNMLSWITGPQASDPSAWKPIKKGTGSPLTFENLASMEAMAGSGGSDYQSFLADQMLKGATPAGAIAALKSTIRSGQASQDLIDSMPGNTQQDATIFGGKAPDLTSDQGFTQAFDTKTLLSDANDMHRGMAKDRALQNSAYQDPTTGQFYTGYAETPTEQMQAADKLGLAYPTTQYDDPKTQDQYVQQMFGFEPGQEAAQNESRARRIGGLNQQFGSADDAAVKARANQEALMKAWNDNFTAPANPAVGPGNPIRGFDQMRGAPPTVDVAASNPLGLSPDELTNLLGGAGNLAAVQPLAGRTGTPSTAPIEGKVRSEVPVEGTAALGPKTVPKDWKVLQRDVLGYPVLYDTGDGRVATAEGIAAMNDPDLVSKTVSPKYEPSRIPAIPTKTQSTRPQVRVGMDGSVELAEPVNFAKLWDPAFIGSRKRDLRAEDVRTAKTAADKKRAAATGAQEAYGRSLALSADELERAKLHVSMLMLGRQGRTPLNDQLAARSQTVRNMLGY